MSCKSCKKKTCVCGVSPLPVMPPSECNTQDCPDLTPCSEVVSADCVQHIGEDKTCGQDIVYLEGDTLGTIHSKIVDYFCSEISDIWGEMGAFVITVTGDGVDNTDPQNPILNLASVAVSGDYGDLTNTPINVSEFTNDAGYLTSSLNLGNSNLLATANRTFDADNFSLTFTDVSLFTVDGFTKVIPSTALITDKAFVVRNSLDNADLMVVKANGDVEMNSPNGVKVTNYLRTNTWNDANDAVNLIQYSATGFNPPANTAKLKIVPNTMFPTTLYVGGSDTTINTNDDALNIVRFETATGAAKFYNRVKLKAYDSPISNGDLAVAEMSFYIDEASDKMYVKAKYAGGTVKIAELGTFV